MSAKLNLESPDGGRLLTEYEPRDLAKAVRDPNDWSENALENADLMYFSWSLRACTRHNDLEEIEEVQRALTQALTEAESAQKLPIAYLARWTALSTLLEMRRLGLVRADPQGILTRPYVPEILRAVRDTAGVKQSDVQERIGFEITAEQFIHRMNLLEAHGLIARRRTGRDHVVHLTEIGRSLV